jgi:hypothetical protein
LTILKIRTAGRRRAVALVSAAVTVVVPAMRFSPAVQQIPFQKPAEKSGKQIEDIALNALLATSSRCSG